MINADLEIETPSQEEVQDPIQLACDEISTGTFCAEESQNPPLRAVEMQLPPDVLAMLAAGMSSYYLSEGKLCMVPIPPASTQNAPFTNPPPAPFVNAHTTRTGSETLPHFPPA